VAQRLKQAPGRVLALVHRQDLALQLAETLRQEELEVGLVMEGSRTLTTPVVVATVQSLTSEATQDLLAANAMPILTVLIDEATTPSPARPTSASLPPSSRPLAQSRWPSSV